MATRRLPPLPTLNDLLRMYNIRAKKQLSQNFILDPRLLDRIARRAAIRSSRRGDGSDNSRDSSAAGVLEGIHVVEVGPGPGGITRAVLGEGAVRVAVIEKDPRFLASLNFLNEVSGNRMDVHLGDALTFRMDSLFPDRLRLPWEDKTFPDIRLVGNLPFNVSTPLIIRWIRAMSERRDLFSYGRVPLTLTFQHEVARRIVAPPTDPERSRLSVICQNWAEASYEFTLPGGSFVPPPDVDVGLVTFKPLIKPFIDLPYPLVDRVVSTAFRGKQKYLERTVRQLFPPAVEKPMARELLGLSGISPESKPISLRMSEFSRLCHSYLYLCQLNPSLAKYDWWGSQGNIGPPFHPHLALDQN